MTGPGKRYRAAAESYDREQEYLPDHAMQILAGTARSMGVEVAGA